MAKKKKTKKKPFSVDQAQKKIKGRKYKQRSRLDDIMKNFK